MTRMLGTDARTINVVATIAATPLEVLAVIGQVFSPFPFSLTLRDTIGGHPLDGGVLVFDVPRLATGQVVGAHGLSMWSGATAILRPGLKNNRVADRAIAASLAAAGLGVGALALVGYRAIFRHALRKSIDQLDDLLASLSGHLRSRAIFGGHDTGAGRRLGPGLGGPAA